MIHTLQRFLLRSSVNQQILVNNTVYLLCDLHVTEDMSTIFHAVIKRKLASGKTHLIFSVSQSRRPQEPVAGTLVRHDAV